MFARHWNARFPRLSLQTYPRYSGLSRALSGRPASAAAAAHPSDALPKPSTSTPKPSRPNGSVRPLNRESATTPRLATLPKKKSAVRRVDDTVRRVNSVADVAQHPAGSCFAYCTARQYQLDQLLLEVQAKFGRRIYSERIGDDYVHVALGENNNQSGGTASAADYFFFREGSMVSWWSDKSTDSQVLAAIAPAQVDTYGPDLQDEEEMRCYVVNAADESCVAIDQRGSSAHSGAAENNGGTGHRPTIQTGIYAEDIVINGQQAAGDAFYAKLAFSHGLARSTNLGALENHLHTFLASIEHVPRYLMQGREPPLSARDVLCKQGELLHIRGLLNLHSDLVDSSPELYWSRNDLAKYFESVSRTMDILPRIRVLNQRLDHANRLIDLMKDRLTEKHGIRLELIIIWLIAVEVAFEMVHYLNELEYIDLKQLLGHQALFGAKDAEVLPSVEEPATVK